MNRNKQTKSTDWLIKGYNEEELARMKAEAIKEANVELRDKQTEEMAMSLAKNLAWDDDVIPTVDCLETAKRLYSIGYRKVERGEWIKKDGFYICSNCERTKPFAIIKDEIHYFGCGSCPHCGADMRGTTNDGE